MMSRCFKSSSFTKSTCAIHTITQWHRVSRTSHTPAPLLSQGAAVLYSPPPSVLSYSHLGIQ